MALPSTTYPQEHRRVHSNDCERQANEGEPSDMQNLTGSPQGRAQARGRMASAIRRNTRWSAKKVAPETWPSERNKKQPRQKQRTYPAKMFAGLRACGTNKLPMDDPPTPPPGALYPASTPTQSTVQIHEPARAQTEATASSSMTRAQMSRKGRGSESIVGMQAFWPIDKELVGYYLRRKRAGTLSPQEEALIPDRNVYESNPYFYNLYCWQRDFVKDVTTHISFTLLSWDKLMELIHIEQKTSAENFSCRNTQGLSRQLQPRMYEYEILTVNGKDHPEQFEDWICRTSPHPEDDVNAEPAHFPLEDKRAGPSLATSETCRICKVYDMSNAVAAQMSTRADARLAIIGDVQLSEDISSPAGIRIRVLCSSVKHTCVPEEADFKEVSMTNASIYVALQASGSLLWTNSNEGQTSGQVDEGATGDYGTRPAASSPHDAFMHGTNERTDQHVASPHSTARPRVKLTIDCSQFEDPTDTYNSATDLNSLLAASSVVVSMHLLCNQLMIM
eukprot:SM000401S15610  [mRNA]  locus=s401:78:3082:+ [translate_table: standard]